MATYPTSAELAAFRDRIATCSVLRPTDDSYGRCGAPVPTGAVRCPDHDPATARCACGAIEGVTPRAGLLGAGWECGPCRRRYSAVAA